MTTISKERLHVRDYYRILFENEQIDISNSTVEIVEKCHTFLKEFSVNKVIYGVNTGLGPMAQYRIEPEDQIKLQYNRQKPDISL